MGVVHLFDAIVTVLLVHSIDECRSDREEKNFAGMKDGKGDMCVRRTECTRNVESAVWRRTVREGAKCMTNVLS